MSLEFSVVTSVLNARSLLEITCNSIRIQNHPIQWIVVDGGSNDGIEEFYKENSDIVSDFIPGPDRGIYDSWNKALRKIEGKWVVFLGAGDTFSSENVLIRASKLLGNLDDHIEIAYGNIFLISEKNNEIILHDVKPWNEIKGKVDLLIPILPSHAGVFHRRSLLERVGRFDDTYRIAADSKMQLQALRNGDFSYLGIDVANVVAGGVSFRAENHLRILSEHRRIAKDLGISNSLFSLTRCYTNALAKIILFKVLGKEWSYKVFDSFRILKGLDKKWG